MKRLLQHARTKLLATKDTVASAFLGAPKLKLPISPVSHLLLSNLPPTESEAALVKVVINEAREEYERILSKRAEELIFGRLSRLTGGKTRFERLGDHLYRHESVLSPIRRIPQEILQEIFLYFSDIDVYYLKDDARWQIAQVCQFWRANALSLSSLWSRLPALHQIISEELPKYELSVLSEFLRRSRNAPLDITITDNRPHPCQPSTHPILILLVDQCERWRRLSMKGSISTLVALQSIKGRLPLLQVLSLHVVEYRPYRVIQLTDMFGVAPRLQVVSIRGRGCSRELELPFSQLIQYETSIPSISFNKAPQLHTLAITSCSSITYLFKYSSSDSRPDIANFQNLTKLIIRANFYDDPTRLFLNMCLPSITDICIESRTKALCRAIYETITRSPDPCLLTKLDLRISRYIDGSDLLSLLYVTPVLTELRAGIFDPSSIRALALTQGDQVLVPLLESCSFLVRSDALSNQMRIAIGRFAIMRCEMVDGLRNKDVCRLKTFQVHDFNALALQTKEPDATNRITTGCHARQTPRDSAQPSHRA